MAVSNTPEGANLQNIHSQRVPRGERGELLELGRTTYIQIRNALQQMIERKPDGTPTGFKFAKFYYIWDSGSGDLGAGMNLHDPEYSPEEELSKGPLTRVEWDHRFPPGLTMRRNWLKQAWDLPLTPTIRIYLRDGRNFQGGFGENERHTHVTLKPNGIFEYNRYDGPAGAASLVEHYTTRELYASQTMTADPRFAFSNLARRMVAAMSDPRNTPQKADLRRLDAYQTRVSQ